MKATIVIREVGRKKPDYSLDFELPGLPSIGDYISIFRPDMPHHSEDLIVRAIWWQLHHPEARSSFSGTPKIGKVQDLYIECDVAVGPYSSKRWSLVAESAASRGVEIAKFDVERLPIPDET